MKIQKRHIVLASLVLALGAAVYLNWQLSDSSGLINSGEASKELGQAKYVNSSVTVTENNESTSPTQKESQKSSQNESQFAEAKTNRDQTQDSVVSAIKEISADSNASDEAKKQALDNLGAIEGIILKQNNVEGILTAKGFSKCICYVSDDSCTVVVLKEDLQRLSPLIIKDAVNSQCGIDYDKISIVEL